MCIAARLEGASPQGKDRVLAPALGVAVETSMGIPDFCRAAKPTRADFLNPETNMGSIQSVASSCPVCFCPPWAFILGSQRCHVETSQRHVCTSVVVEVRGAKSRLVCKNLGIGCLRHRRCVVVVVTASHPVMCALQSYAGAGFCVTEKSKP